MTGILTRSRPWLLGVLDRDDHSRADVLAILDVPGDELASYGFDAASKPTAYGRLLEQIVDEVNRIGFE